MMQRSIDLILFDLGGVLLELGPSPVPLNLLPQQRNYTLADWFESETAVAFEKGLISSEVFIKCLIDELELNCTAIELIDHFNAWPRGLYPGAIEILPRLRADYRVAILTNTNALHWPRFSNEFTLNKYVERIFASHLLGMVKPEADIFIHVATELGLAPQQILFIDDNTNNVEAASQLGFVSHHAQGFTEVLQTLRRCGILEF